MNDKERLNANISEIKRIIFILISMIIIAEIFFIHSSYKEKLNEQKHDAVVAGNNVVVAIQTEITKCVDTTELLEDLYIAYGDAFYDNFAKTCSELIKDELAIGSMYFAPNGIIKYAYPDKVDETTANFEMLKDDIQGPKANLAVETGEITIAGPHVLIEGGTGFIIRNPIYDMYGSFDAFTITVIDKDIFVKQVMERLGENIDGYKFAVWKDEDTTAVYEENGWIIMSSDSDVSKDITIPFEAPNDNWYLAIEPVGGFNPFSRMVSDIIVSLVVITVIIIGLNYYGHNLIMRRQIAETHRDEVHKRELENALLAAESANRAKTSFLFNMSHDIRTPMNAIIGFTELLERHAADPDKRAEYIKKIRNSNTYLLELINNILELARIENGKIKIQEIIWNYKTFSENLASIFEYEMKKKKMDFDYSCDISQEYVYCDPMREREIFLNILSNAIKYTKPGGKISMQIKEIPCDIEGQVLFETVISDTGIGMSEEFLPKIFEDFARERSTTESRIEGTGLGMPITKRLVKLFEGTIEVESKVGVGTKFTVVLPHKIATEEMWLKEQAAQQMEIKNVATKSILVVEDNELNQEIAIDLLTEEGFVTDLAEDGQIAVDMVKNAAPGTYDLILMDVQMPNMNGYEATRAIRALGDSRKANIPIVAMTANAFEDDKKNAKDAGMNGHLAKPISMPELKKMLAELLN